jgi:riboflavin kinase/FMN adenylyltransferase
MAVTIGGAVYRGVGNFGNRPTLGNGDQTHLEVHLFDFEADVYGEVVDVEFLGFVRAEKSFSSLKALTEQIRADVEAAKKLLDNI